ncbi:SIR2 family protein [Pseudomonas sp. MAP12]|uniref:SIR2 family protein n=1 Tax=Geopseudomonas aromaticivorans TaxID=2849492 RepID=A0ABS6MZ46_9GAMM|nr:SIR2 family protein [Pseudomonas aromaticivorans]MBV2134073.1 SIR2 family protein [Pseudomonas aromaticivorans]
MEFWRPKYHEYLNSEGDIEIIGSTFQRSRILKELEPETYQLSFEDWVEERKSSLRDLANQVLAAHDNANRFSALKKAYSSRNVIPFLGAGLSIPSGYPGWTKFLWDLQIESHVNADELESLLNDGDYEGAAQLIHDDLGPALFNKQLQECFDRNCIATGAINLLPFVFPGSNVITTNFDKLLESVFRGQDQGFDQPISGGNLGEALRIINAGGRYLLKLHGSCETVANRVLLREEYEQAYGDAGIVARFFSRFLFGKSLLFVGCSLLTDRTLRTMEQVVTAEGAHTLPQHYAFLELKDGVDRVERKKALARANIFPIWYPEGEHDESIEALLLALMEGEK